MKYTLLLLVSSLVGCAGLEQYPRHNLADQILRPRPGYDGCLTNRACEAWNEQNECTNYVIQKRCLTIDAERKSMFDLRFVCNVGGRRWKVCPDKPGLCRVTYSHCGFLGMNKCQKIEFMDAVDGYQFLIDADTKCFSQDAYAFEIE